ncbi:GYF domain-containing protein [Geomesophilobacter sediminis]|uniref:DUF4339 domain-containing protein n=1 Tax=Geomesophilobacter sediminis TaxID=2798584 RepID=A0A8J7M2G1_9BACT|nr:DUF4339 domain-containing protein [Geomesophilobacter sediminis]MBJ6727427.1 DUF4339 domain-containing protein [Geomesophilobacter sediminis]
MALVACKKCASRISSRAVTCPKCGAATGAEAPVPPAAKQSVPRAKVAELRPSDTRKPQRKPDPAGNTKASPGNGAAPGAIAADTDLPPAEAWYYVNAGGLQGPVRLERIRTLAASGTLAAETPIWRAGLADWVLLSEYRESAVEAAPEELIEAAEPAPANYLLWVLALAPLWGGIVQIVATETTVSLTRRKLAYYGELWWITVLINILVCYVDFYRVRKGGAEVGKGESWLCLAVPAYLYHRDREVPARPPKLWVWIASLIVTLVLIMYLNGVYAKISMK